LFRGQRGVADDAIGPAVYDLHFEFVLLRFHRARDLNAETVATLTAGEPARQLRVQGDSAFVRTQNGVGWVEREKLGLVCSPGKQLTQLSGGPVSRRCTSSNNFW
jgi:hypothetical protein